MTANPAMDPALLELVRQASGERTREAAVTRALEEIVARRGQRHVIDLLGKLEWDTSFDYKAERSRCE